MADDSTDAQPGGKRFPFISLEKALARAEQLYQADRNGRPMALATVFEVWEYSDKSSGGHQTIAALKSYGLVTAEGGGRLNLSADALRYFKDEREDERLRLRKAFALRPELIGAVWKVWGPAPPADNVARSYLKLDRSLGEQQARSFLGLYKENLAFADLKTDDKVVRREEPEEDNPEVMTPAREQQAPPERRAPPKAGMKEDVFTLDEGDVVLQWPDRLSKESFEDIESWMQIQLRKIKRHVIEGE